VLADAAGGDLLPHPGSNGSAAESPSALGRSDRARHATADPYALPQGELSAPGGSASNGLASPSAERRSSGSLVADQATHTASDRRPRTGIEVVELPEPETPEAGEPVTNPDGSWEWKDRHLTAEQCAIADQALDKCRAAEGRNVFGSYREAGLTPAMRRIESQLDNGYLVPETDRFALKSADRFKEKLADRISAQPGIPAQLLAAQIHDAIRYTFLLEPDHYTEGVRQVSEALEKGGYELTFRKPSWGSQDYKGVNTQWQMASGDVIFEVQFHTPDSWRAKQRNHEAYERLSSPTTPPDVRRRLDSEQRETFKTVLVPPGAESISSYRKDRP
jgi:hypothetical protein